MLTRRRFVAWSLAAGSAAALPRFVRGGTWTAQPAPQGLDVKQVREGMHAILGGGGNSLVIRTGEGGILIDTKLPQVVTNLHAHVKELLGEPPAIVINTHHHGDHVGGNYAFHEQASIVGHANIRPRLQDTIDGWIRNTLRQMASQARQNGDEAAAERLVKQAEELSLDHFAADESYEKEHLVERGRHRLTMRHITPGHTDNDSIIHFPEHNMVHMGDLLFHRVHPFMDVGAGSNSRGWRDCLRAAIRLCDEKTIVVPGHGEITDLAGIQSQIHYFERLEETARQAIKDGVSREDVRNIAIDEFASYGGGRLGANLQAVYDEVKAAG